MAPAYVGNVRAVGHVAFELCILALEERKSVNLKRPPPVGLRPAGVSAPSLTLTGYLKSFT